MQMLEWNRHAAATTSTVVTCTAFFVKQNTLCEYYLKELHTHYPFYFRSLYSQKQGSMRIK